jgi:type IV pilus assembly protein PilC
VINGIVEYSILERFCRILGAMVKAGVPLPDAMKTTTEATNNTVFRERLIEAQAEMMEGGGFAKPLARTELFPGAARQMFKVGEETGTLDAQLAVAGLYFDRELESRIKRFTTMFEPAMIVFVGVIVGFVAVAWCKPCTASSTAPSNRSNPTRLPAALGPAGPLRGRSLTARRLSKRVR